MKYFEPPMTNFIIYHYTRKKQGFEKKFIYLLIYLSETLKFTRVRVQNFNFYNEYLRF